jgi:hypothetical protein
MELADQGKDGEAGGLTRERKRAPHRPLENPFPSGANGNDPILEPHPGEPGVDSDGTAVPLENPRQSRQALTQASGPVSIESRAWRATDRPPPCSLRWTTTMQRWSGSSGSSRARARTPASSASARRRPLSRRWRSCVPPARRSLRKGGNADALHLVQAPSSGSRIAGQRFGARFKLGSARGAMARSRDRRRSPCWRS